MAYGTGGRINQREESHSGELEWEWKGAGSCLSKTGFGLNQKTHKGVVFRCRCRLRCRNREMSSLEYDYDRDNDSEGAIGDTDDAGEMWENVGDAG